MQQNNRTFPTWHFSMLNDKTRNTSINNAIKNANVKGKTVFEIGTGSGIISLLFAKYGAKKVITCESNQELFKISSQIIKNSEFSNIIEIIPKNNTEVIENNLLTVQPDIIFTETLDCGIIGEGFYSIARDIQKIAIKNTKILPNKITQLGFLVNSEDIYSLNSVNKVEGFDLSLLNIYQTKNYFPVRSNLYKVMLLSSIYKISNYDYLNNSLDNIEFIVKANKSNKCHGIISYFIAYFDDYIVSNQNTNSHWHQAFHPLSTPINITKGCSYICNFTQNGTFSIRRL